MRRAISLPRLARDDRGTAPYAVVAVIILLGASMSYAYLAHLNASRLQMDGQEPWSDGAMEALDNEEASFREAVRASLATAVALHDGADSTDLVSSIGSAAEQDLVAWAAGRYPWRQRPYTATAEPPRITVSAVYGTVTTGNVLGMQLPQSLPVGIEAVGAITLSLEVDGGARVSREVTARAHRTEPAVLAAQLQNVLEYSLADEGLVPRLMADALSEGLAEDPAWVPTEEALEEAVDGALGIVERSLFHADTGPSALRFGAGDLVSGTTLMSAGGQGQLMMPMPRDGTLTLADPMVGGEREFRFVPWVEWRARQVDLRTSRLWSAEASGPGGAVIARLDMAGRFDHRVDVWSGESRVGSVTRTIEFRDHLEAWAEDPAFAQEGGRRMGKAQVEDWEDLRTTMSVVSPPPRQVVLDVPEEFGSRADLALDGVHLGTVGTGQVLLENVAAGPHQLLVRSSGPDGTTASYLNEVIVLSDGPTPYVAVAPREAGDGEAAYAFWFSVMAALHRPGAGPLAHLEHIAAMSGYAGLPDEVGEDPRGHLEEVVFWLEGLDHHLEFEGGSMEERGAPDPLATWKLAKEVVSISKLTFKLLVKLPQKMVQAGEVVVELSSAEGRAAFIVRCQEAGETIELLEAAEEADGSCTVRFHTDAGTVLKRAGSMLSALSIITKSMTIGFDVVELQDAVAEGNGTAIVWAVYDLSVDLAQIVISTVKFACDLGVMALSKVTQAVLSIVGSAISVVAAFLDAFRDAGNDFWGAWELLLNPVSFGDALRTAGFLSALASLVTTIVVTAALPVLTGVGVGAALSMAVLAASGVGLIVLGAVLAVWAIFHYEEIKCWVHGSVTSDAVDAVEKDVSSLLSGTLDLMANLNTVNVTSETSGARMERGVGLALMDLRATSGDAGLVDALCGAPHYHLDRGSAQGRRARAVVEARHWIVTLWREVDDLLDEDRASSDGEASEGFPDDRGALGGDHDFDADIRVKDADGMPGSLDQRGIGGFLRSADLQRIEGWTVRVRIEGDLYKEALEEWVEALGAIAGQLGEATSALARASREITYASSSLAEVDYDRGRTLVELRLPEQVERARVLVECTDGAVLVDGEPVEGPVQVFVENGTVLLGATGRSVRSQVVTYSSDSTVEMNMEADCSACQWWELGFGRSALAHVEA
jgi:hypothetical protein